MPTSYPFEVNFKKNKIPMEFIVHSGVVIGTDQRSDTIVSGGGGQGGGYVPPTTSRVRIARDIYTRDIKGKERNLRIYKDIPVRAGQVIHEVWLKGSLKDPVLYSIYNSTLEKWWLMDSGVPCGAASSISHKWTALSISMIVIMIILGMHFPFEFLLFPLMIGVFIAIKNADSLKRIDELVQQYLRECIPEIDKSAASLHASPTS